MDWMEEVQQKLRRKNQILFSADSPFLQGLANALSGCGHQALVLWALELAEADVCLLEKAYPEDPRPRGGLAAAWMWASGDIKMHAAQRAILDCHAVAKEISSPEHIALCHAVGQACGVVHTPGHAMGLPIYELTALVRRDGPEHCRAAVEARRQTYLVRLDYWKLHASEVDRPWAPFLCR